mgnify:CR=1 FL=1
MTMTMIILSLHRVAVIVIAVIVIAVINKLGLVKTIEKLKKAQHPMLHRQFT